MKKTNNRKNIMLASMLLGTVALAGVGYSAWVITLGDTKSADVTVTVDSVSKEEMTINLVDTGKDYDVRYAATTSKSVSWFQGTADLDNPCDLDALIPISVDKVPANVTTDNLISGGYLNVTVSGDEAFTNALNDELVSEPVVSYESVTLSNRTATLIVKVSFNWGDKFENKNPTDYYGSKNASDKISEAEDAKTFAEDAYETLISPVWKGLGSAKFTVTITSNPTPLSQG